MRRWLFAIIALVLLIAVTYVFVSPAVDLDPTVTRAWQLAALLICSLAYLGRMIVALVFLWGAGTLTVCYAGLDTSPPPFARLSPALLCSCLC